jgi:acyl carrier protein
MPENNEIILFLIEKMHQKAKKLEVIFEDEVDDSFNITGSGLFDSMDFMNLIIEVEEKFGVEVDFTNELPEVFTTINGFVKCIK